ncbi:MAG: DUF2213 domain-containing protein [Deferribacterales bacterium]
MPDKVHRCVEKLKKKGIPEAKAWAICNASIKDSTEHQFDIKFTDAVKYNAEEHSLVSVRDGKQMYHSSELGIADNRMMSIYRSPYEIACLYDMLDGLPITNNHIEIDGEVPEELKAGKINTTELIDIDDKANDATIALQHSVIIDNADLMQAIKDGKKELSLGYTAKVIKGHDAYDFEYVNIIPHHLAVVDAGRCGAVCSFLDNKTDMESANMAGDKETVTDQFKALIKDAQGKYNMRAIIEMVNMLPEIIGDMPLDELNKIAPTLEKILQMARPDKEGQNMIDAKITDSDEFKQAVKDAADKLVKDAVMEKMKELPSVMAKAGKVLDVSYDYAGKTPCEIMKDSVVAHYGKEHGFRDEEIGVAFKAIQTKPDHGKFVDVEAVHTDRKPFDIATIGDKEWK